MTKIWLKKLIEKLNRSDGVSIMAVVVLMLIMTVMGGVFTSIMGGWKISAPMAINSNKAFYLAETASVFALQNAEDRFFGPKFTIGSSANMGGTRAAPYVVSINGTAANGEIAEYWIERPSQDGVNVYDDDDNSVIVVSDSDTLKAIKMRDDTVDDDTDDLNVADDQNLDGISDRYTIIATGTVTRGGAVAARKQIKVAADIYRTSPTDILPGIHTISPIGGVGSGMGHLSIENPTDSLDVEYDNTGQVGGNPAGLIYNDQPVLNEDVFYAMADDQGPNHVKPLGYILNDTQNYPSNSFFYDSPTDDIPNYSYINGTLDIVGARDIWGVVWVTGDVVSDGTARVHGIIICFGNIVMNGGGNPTTPQIDGGIIQYDNGSNAIQNNSGVELDISINNGYFNALNRSIPIVNTVSWEEATSQN